MNQLRTTAIVLRRVDYGEADRILTVLTPDAGKLSLMARGARKQKSKLAGGIELFGTNEITYVAGRGNIDTLISSRLTTHYGHIVQDIDRTMLGYELIKLLDKVTEDEPEPVYYDLLASAYVALDDDKIPADLIRAWFSAQLLSLAGHTPNLQKTSSGEKLEAAARYQFDYDTTSLSTSDDGIFGADEIKCMRLLFGPHKPSALCTIQGLDGLVSIISPAVLTLRQLHLRT